MVEETKNDEHTNVLIPWYPVSYLTIASSGFFFGGRLRVPTRRCDLVVPADGGWGRSNEIKVGGGTGQNGHCVIVDTSIVRIHSRGL